MTLNAASRVLLIAVIGPLGTYAQGGQTPAKDRFSLTLDPSHVEAKIGSELKVSILLKNLTDKYVVMNVENGSQGEFDYTIRLMNKGGQEPSHTKYFRAVRGEDSGDASETTTLVVVGSSGYRGLKPGEGFVKTIDLNKLYLLKPGKYTVQVERMDDESKTIVKSNIITVTVTPESS